MQTDNRVAFTVTWAVREGEVEAAVDIIARFVPEARKEPGLEFLMVNRSVTNPAHFLFYEVFRDAAAFEAHQAASSQTPAIIRPMRLASARATSIDICSSTPLGIIDSFDAFRWSISFFGRMTSSFCGWIVTARSVSSFTRPLMVRPGSRGCWAG